MATADQLLDALPLDLLIALHTAVGDPTADGQERARLSAHEAGFWILCLSRPDGCEGVHDPLPMPSGEDEADVTAHLRFAQPSP